MIMIVEKVRNDNGQWGTTWDGGNAKEIMKNIRQCQVYTRETLRYVVTSRNDRGNEKIY
jgi:hypothetical protein